MSIKNKSKLKGRNVIVTGASGGLGREITLSLIRRYGCQVLGVARNEEKLRSLGEELGELGEKYGISKAAVAIAWILRHPARMQAIVGTMNPQHLADICTATDIRLTHQEWYKLYLASGKFLP